MPRPSRPELEGRAGRWRGRGHRGGARRGRCRLEGEGEVPRGLESPLGLLFQAVAKNRHERRCFRRDRGGRLAGLFLEDRRHRLRSRLSLKRPGARQHLVEHGAEGKDVRPLVHRNAPDLLRGHVPDGPHDRSGLREAGHGRRLRFFDGIREPRAGLGKPEVEDLHPLVPCDEDVVGLQVPMDDALLVRRREAERDLHAVLPRPTRGQRARQERLAQRLALEELRDRVGHRPFVPEIMNREDVGMRQRRDRLRLAPEPRERVRILREALRQHLDRHGPLQPRIPRPIHLPHPARAERRQDLVRPELRSRVERHASDRLQRVSRHGFDVRSMNSAMSALNAFSDGS